MENLETESREIGVITAPAHEHTWWVESRHATSEGQVTYVRCGACGTRRVDVQEHSELPPRAVSAELPMPRNPGR